MTYYEKFVILKRLWQFGDDSGFLPEELGEMAEELRNWNKRAGFGLKLPSYVQTMIKAQGAPGFWSSWR